MNTEQIRAAAFEAAPGSGGAPVGTRIIAHGLDHVPAELPQGNPFAQLGAYIEQRDTFRPEHPLMAVSSDEIGLNGPEIELERTQALDRIDTEQDVAPATEFADPFEIHAQTGGILDRTHRDQPGALINAAE